MSCQPPPWTRRNVSPKQQPRPVRATVPVSLMRQQNQGSSQIHNNNQKQENSSNLATKCYELDKPKVSSQEKPTLFLGPRGEKSKTLNLRTQPQQYHIRRTSSLDALFLASQWQPEAIFLGHFMVDKATQTPDEWNEGEFRKAQWKTMVTGGEQLEVKYIRQKLQRTNQNSRTSGVLLCSQRQSPIQGDHSAVSNLDSGSLNNVYHTGAFGVVHKATHTPPVLPAVHISRPIPIAQGPKLNIPRLQSSLESLNQEIEKLVLKDSVSIETDGNAFKVFEPTPEGHRAPIAELFHSFSNMPGHENCTSSETSSRSHSISPAVPIIPGNPEYSMSPSTDDAECVYKLGSSPHINQFLTREPPDGCEKVKIVEELRRQPVVDLSSGSCLPKPQVTCVLLPSQSSAFCPLYKELEPPSPLCDSYNVLSQSQNTPKCHK